MGLMVEKMCQGKPKRMFSLDPFANILVFLLLKETLPVRRRDRLPKYYTLPSDETDLDEMILT
jgi:hypothetical protein